MEKTRVLFLLSDLKTGGAQRVVLTVAHKMNREKFDVHMGVIRGKGPLSREIPEALPVHDLKVRRVRYALPFVLRLCWKLKPDAVLSTLSHLNLSLISVRSLLPRRTRILVREANTPSVRLQHTLCPGAYRFLYKKAYPFADKIICNSRFVQKDLADHFSIEPQRTVVLPNPVDRERIKRKAGEFPDPFLPGKFNLLSVGRLSYQKGFDLLLKAFAEALGVLSTLHLTIVGGGEEEGSLRKLAARLGCRDSVTFAGLRINPYPYMAHADLFISSSRWEGSPNAVLESLACGTPVLAFDCPGGTGEILEEGKNGWLAPREDWKAMSRKIVGIAERREGLNVKERSLLPGEFALLPAVGNYEKVLAEKKGGHCF